MTHPRKDASRRCMPFDEWPDTDQAAWRAAVLDEGPLGDSGAAAHWRPGTCHKVTSSYGRWMTYLSRRGLLDPTQLPAERITEERLRGYVAELTEQVAPVTRAQRLVDLCEALRVMAHGLPLPRLRRITAKLTASARPSRDKRARYLPPADILHRALALLERIEQAATQRPEWRAVRYRDALILAILAARPTFRRRNLASIELERHLVQTESGYLLRFGPEETKQHRPVEQFLPEVLNRAIERYLSHFRPILLNGRISPGLWIAAGGTDLAEITLYLRLRKLTKKEFGVPLNPHAFRDGPATAMAIDDPVHVATATTILEHVDSRTTEKHYNQARMIDAARRYQASLVNLRRKHVRKRPLRPA